MAGYWPSSSFFIFYFFALLWTEMKLRFIKTQKRTRSISIFFLSDLLYGQYVTPSISFNVLANVSARDFQN